MDLLQLLLRGEFMKKFNSSNEVMSGGTSFDIHSIDLKCVDSLFIK